MRASRPFDPEYFGATHRVRVLIDAAPAKSLGGKRTMALTTPGESTPAADIGRATSGSSSDPAKPAKSQAVLIDRLAGVDATTPFST